MNNMTRAVSAEDSRNTAGVTDVVDIGAFLSLMWRRKMALISSIFLGLILGALYAYVLATPMYRSTAVVMLNNREQQIVDFESVVGNLGSDGVVINTELEVLKSSTLLGKVVDKLRLTEDAEFNPALRPPSISSRVKSYVKSKIYRNETTPPSVERQRLAAIESLRRSIEIQNVPKSVVFNISAITTEASKSTDIAKTLAQTYIVDQIEVKFEATEQATSWLSERVAELKSELESAEARLTEFRGSISFIGADNLRATETQIKQNRQRIEELNQDLRSAEVRLQNLLSGDGSQSQIDTLANPSLSDSRPQIEGLGYDQPYQQLVVRAENEIARLKSQISVLRESVTDLTIQVEEENSDSSVLQQLTREVEASRLLYEYFLGRLKETSVQQGILQADSRVISPAAEPVAAAYPKKSQVVIIFALLGGLIGSALVVIADAVKRAFRSTEELATFTGYQVYGQVVRIPEKYRKNAISYLKTRPTSVPAESIRNLRTSIMLDGSAAPPQVIMISSAYPGEGKTTVSLALAQNFAEMGKKTLLIEGDIRRRILNEYLELGKGGLVSVLTGEHNFSEVVSHHELINADVLPGDVYSSSAADIFSSPKFAELIESARNDYDVILVDTPPVLIVPDARLISQIVDASILVVKWDETDPKSVMAALKEFESVGRPVSGLVLSQVDLQGAKRYGYGYGAYGAYEASYHSS